MYKRRKIAKVCFNGILRIKDAFKLLGIEVETLVIVSNKEDQSIADSFGFYTVEAENLPIGKKLNTGLRAALLQLPFDYLMNMGSDDLLSVDAPKKIAEEMEKETPFFGFTSLALYNSETGEGKQSHSVGVFGAGRCTRRDILLKASEQVYVMYKESFSGPTMRGLKGAKEWVPKALMVKGLSVVLGDRIALWEDDRNSALDFNSERAIESSNKIYVRNIQGLDTTPFVLDIKSKENIHSYESLKQNEKKLSIDYLVKRFPEVKQLVCNKGGV